MTVTYVPGQIYLGTTGSESLLPEYAREVTPTPIEITKTTRTIDGTLREEVIRKYTNYQIDYELLIGPDQEGVEDIYNLNAHMNLIVVDRSGTPNAQTVKMTWNPGVRKSIAGDWVWAGVSITLEAV